MKRTDSIFGSRSMICDLPTELLLKIMGYLPAESLWAVRQSSRCFLQLFDAKDFRYFHSRPGRKDRYKPFRISAMVTAERNKAAEFIRRNRKQPEARYCAPCLEVRRRGKQESRLASLLESRFCEGCKERHGGIFFSTESIEKHDRGIGELICIGRLGKMTLCSHDSHEPVTWQTFEQSIPMSHDLKEVACTDRSHEPRARGRWVEDGSAFPRLILERWAINDNIEVTLGWDLQLLDINPKNPPSTEAIRETLANLFLDGAAFCYHKPCKHMLDGERIRAFAYSGICECFKQPGNTRHPRKDGITDRKYKCPCDRQRRLKCADCGALYAWYLVAGRITLSYRSVQHIEKPTSPAWLGLLDDVPNREDIFNEDNRHLIWCDSPGCATGRGPRWEEMVKEQARMY
ncbi:hypothetical protein BGZ63DRAFT_356947 [Mariannaea sp. PMI_226]|nr:hypothetical protein BGZ63DRAFT_356947 [Mariannaea sp. PMI_226]